MPRRDIAELHEALRHFERAIQLDPQYARAYVGAHDTIHLLGVYGGVTEADKQKQARYLQRAIELGPNLGEAHVSKAVSLENSGQIDAAIAEYRRGLALSPGYATGWQWLGEIVAFAYGDYDEAMPLMTKARELDPLSPVINGTYLFHLAQSGRVEEALAGMDASIAENPRVARSYDDRASVHQMRGDLVATLRDYKRQDEIDPKAFGFRSHRCMAIMDFGALDEAEACLEPLARQAPNASFVLATRARLAYLRGDWLNAERLLPYDTESGMQGYGAAIRIRRNDVPGALALYRSYMPKVLDGSRPPPPAQVYDAIHAGIALMRTGDDARGRALIKAALDAIANRPYAASVAARSWLEVLAHEARGDRKAALDALQRGVDAGYVQQIADLDADPLLADLHKDPRYARILAPARAVAAAKVDQAREAGLL
jgi:tetratricopeptide (TPR) repeat protein